MMDQDSGPVRADTDLDEGKLIELVLDGSGASYDLLVMQYQEVVFRVAWLLLRDSDAAEDAAQSAFIKAYHALNRFDRKRPFKPWLLQDRQQRSPQYAEISRAPHHAGGERRLQPGLGRCSRVAGVTRCAR